MPYVLDSTVDVSLLLSNTQMRSSLYIGFDLIKHLETAPKDIYLLGLRHDDFAMLCK